MAAYTEEFYRLSLRCDLSMTEEQQTAKYINGLKYSIQERVALQDVFSIDKAENKVMKIERLHSRALPFKGATERTSGNTIAQQSFTTSERPSFRKAIDTPLANLAIAAAPTTKGKENPYAKPSVMPQSHGYRDVTATYIRRSEILSRIYAKH